MTYVEYIENDIEGIRERHQIDVSGVVGRVLYSFVSYWKNPSKEDSVKIIPIEFYNLVRGLEAYLIKRIIGSLTLEETIKSGGEICKMLGEKNEEKITKLEEYLHELTERKPKERVIFSLNVPEE